MFLKQKRNPEAVEHLGSPSPGLPRRYSPSDGGEDHFALHHVETGRLVVGKRLTTPRDPAAAVFAGIEALMTEAGATLARWFAEAQVRAFLDSLVANRLMVTDGTYYLALAVRINPTSYEPPLTEPATFV